MSYPKKVIKIEPAGYNPDQPQDDAKFWEVAVNMSTSAGKTVSVPGWARIYGNVFSNPNNSNTIVALTNLESNSVNYWVYHTPANSGCVQSSSHTDITIAAGWSSNVTDPSWWTSGVLNGVAFVNNRVDPPAYWAANTSAKFATLPDWDSNARARRMVAHKNFLFALGIENSSGIYPEMVAWSDSAAPGTIPQAWTANSTTDAGSTILAETGGEIVTAKSLRDILIIYKQFACYSCRYIGGNDIFAFDTLFTNRGALGTHSVADIGGAHFVVGDGDVYITDGSSYKSVADGFIKSALFGQLNSNTYNQLFVTYKPTTHSVQVNFPSLGANTVDTCLEYNLNDGLWGSKELSPLAPSTAAIGYVSDEVESGLWDEANTAWDTANSTYWNARSYSTAASSMVYGSTQLYKGDYGDTKDGSQLTFRGIVTNISFEDPSRVKYVKALYPSIYGEPGAVVNFRVGSSKSIDGSISWSDTIPFTIGTSERVECRVMGKLIAIEVSSTSQVMINSITLEADMRGYR